MPGPGRVRRSFRSGAAGGYPFSTAKVLWCTTSVMPMVPSGHKTLVHYPDGASKVITLYTRPVEGQIIAHGWQVTKVAAGGDDGNGVFVEYQISVARPANEFPEKADTSS